MKLTRRKFETVVHLGLLVIVFVLLVLNFRSNLVIYRAAERERLGSTVGLYNSALSIGRIVQRRGLIQLDSALRAELQNRHSLRSVHLVSQSELEDAGSGATGLPEQIIKKVEAGDYKRLIAGEASEYFYIYRFSTSFGDKLLVLGAKLPELAHLDSSSRTLIVVNVVAVLAIAVLYMLLFRVILSPFRRIKKQALDAGRHVGGATDDVEALVNEYQNMIDELQQKESQLVLLNRAIQKKADSLEQLNEYLLNSMSSGLVMVDVKGKIVSANEATGKILDVSPQTLSGKPFRDLPGLDDEVVAAVRAVLRGEHSQFYREYDLKTVSDDNLTLGINISAIHDDTLSNIGASILINDLTEIKDLRREVESRNRLAALGEMAGGLAHQLRNSIGAMSGYCHLVRKRLLKSNLETDSITALEEETKEAEDLVDRFLHFARPFDFSPDRVDLVELVEDLAQTFRIKPNHEHIEVVVSTETGGAIVADIDGLLIKQALANLIENAVNAYKGGPGQIDLDLSLDAEHACVRVRDYGCGIAPDDIDKIFTPFFSSRPSGTGLGLPLAKKIIDLHDGRLTVDSRPDSGTVFTVTLPLVQRPHPVAQHA
ncbi:MAG: PAS domain S-box protein [Candidatus Zixiibacteriota bacterium]|nr:MAG: PAS domain S-box protein [candidate division Zixibacteria bacterium]